MEINIDYWMIAEVQEGLRLLKEKRMKEGNWNKWLKFISENEGLQASKNVLNELEMNRWHPLGKVALTNNVFQAAREIQIIPIH